MKLCIDCRYHTTRLLLGSVTEHLCQHPGGISLVTGKYDPPLCEDERAPTGRCGTEGKLFAGKVMDFPAL